MEHGHNNFLFLEKKKERKSKNFWYNLKCVLKDLIYDLESQIPSLIPLEG